MTTDTKAAEVFYDKVVGWTSEPFDASPNPYTQFKRSGGVAVAGLMERPDGMSMPPFWAMYVSVPKLEDAVADLKRLGGSELSPVTSRRMAARSSTARWRCRAVTGSSTRWIRRARPSHCTPGTEPSQNAIPVARLARIQGENTARCGARR